jgi:hypothetical protein
MRSHPEGPTLAASESITLSVVVMHHPRRRDRLPALLDACRPLPVRVIADPEPDGPPSPLRTAKRAWASIAPGASHHVVLQDDVLPMVGFAEHLSRALAARPTDGITLSVQRTSPRNSYAVRRAALAGRAFVGMSAVEWTPTLALALPAAKARALSRFLAGLPDSYVDDDQLVTAFSAEHAVPVIATVPNLVQHADVESLSIYADEGHRPVTVYDENWKVPLEWWSAAGNPPLAAPERPDGGGLAVELRGSRCGLRLLSNDTDEPVEHPFTWDWRDRADLAGVEAGQIAAAWRAALAGEGLDVATAAGLRALSAALTLEVWAAGFLLGTDLSRLADAPGASEAGADEADLVPLLRRHTVRSWIEVGLAGRDRRSLALDEWDVLVDLVLLAVAAGKRKVAQTPPSRQASAGNTSLAGLDAVLRRMARREAATQLLRPNLTTWVTDPVTRVWVRPLPCPYCGADADSVNPVALEPMDEVRALRSGDPSIPGSVTLHALACEWLTARAVLPLVRGVQDCRSDLPPVVLTRAAAAAEIVAREPGASLSDLLSELDIRESWLSEPALADPPRGPQVLPASPRLAPDDAGRDTVGAYVFMPHRIGTEPTGLEEAYRRHRDEAYAAGRYGLRGDSGRL